MLDMKLVFEKLLKGYDKYMGTSENRLFHCPIKKINNLKEVDGVSVERMSRLDGILDGVEGYKEIYVNDITGGYAEKVYWTRDGENHMLVNRKVTTYRCGLMTALALEKFKDLLNGKIYGLSVGFIGCGRTNLQNCKTINELYGISRAVIRGSERDRGRNLLRFMEICQDVEVDMTEDLSLLNECDIVVVCTSSYLKEDMVSTKELSKPKLIIALDCGYLLDESFRKECISYTEYKEQLDAYYSEEFPYDKDVYDICQIGTKMMNLRDSGERVVVYLHGIGLADIIVANEMISEE